MPGDVGTELNANVSDRLKHKSTTVGSPQLEYNKIETGDTAEEEVGIVPTATRGPDEASLRSAIPEAATQL